MEPGVVIASTLESLLAPFHVVLPLARPRERRPSLATLGRGVFQDWQVWMNVCKWKNRVEAEGGLWAQMYSFH